MVYTPKQLADFDVIAELRRFANMADARVKKDGTLAEKVALMKLAKLARNEANRMAVEMEYDKAA